MTTERFRKIDFERALGKVFQPGVCRSKGLIAGEEHYEAIAKTFSPNQFITIQINSSVLKDGLAADTADNSIRCWLADQDGNPLGSKITRWVTRVSGWEQRLEDTLNKLTDMAQAIELCPKCHTIEKIFIVKKDGPNHGRLFVKCNCPNSFTWLGDEKDEVAPTAHQMPSIPTPKLTPPCPKCLKPTIQRHGSKGDFWGCPDQDCRGSMDYFEYSGQDVTKEKAWIRARTFYYHLPVEITPKSKQEPVEVAKPEPTADQKAKLDKVRAGLQAQGFEKPTKFTPNKYQTALFEWTKAAVAQQHTGLKALVLKAYAGTGKSTTLAEMTKLMPRDLDICIAAYNTQNKEDLRKKVPTYAKVNSYHGLGWACLQHNIKGIVLDTEGEKLKGILERTLDKNVHRPLFPAIRQLVGLVKNNLTGTTPEELTALADYYSVELNGSADTIFKAVASIIEQCRANTGVADFDDQIWLPVVLDLPAHQYDILGVDECQDTNKCQIALALKSVKANGIIIAVGDEHQSMYGFRGADAQAIPNLITSLGADVLPLAQTFRCPKSHVAMVREEFPHIPLEAVDWAKEGVISNISANQAISVFASGDMVLSRTNAPLVKPAFALIRQGRKAVIRGRDIGKGLVALIEKMKAFDVVELLKKLGEYKTAEVTKLMAAEKGTQAQAIMDKVETIEALADGVNSIPELTTRISTIFSDQQEGVIFSTVHRAKGLEAEHVFIIRPDLMPHPMAKQDWEMVQEENIRYVAYTRSLDTLTFVHGEF